MNRHDSSHHHVSGFTLLETLISIGVVGAIGILITQVFFATARTNTKTELLKDVKQNGEYAMSVMSRMIRNSIYIESTCSSTGDPTLSSLDVRNSDGNITTFGCVLDASASVLRVASTSATNPSNPDYLTSKNVTIGGLSCNDASTTLTFACTSYPDQPPKITINLKMSQKGTPVDQFEKASILFQTTVSPRF
jgi:type II secretory pathway pseudopilin PulG